MDYVSFSKSIRKAHFYFQNHNSIFSNKKVTQTHGKSRRHVLAEVKTSRLDEHSRFDFNGGVGDTL